MGGVYHYFFFIFFIRFIFFLFFFFFFSSRRRHTRLVSDWSSDVCSSDLILSWVTILLCGLPGSSAGRVGGACSPCTGRGLASRRVATALVGSYPTVSPLPSAPPEICRRRSPFCSTFRRLSPPGSPQRPALRCPDFPRRPSRRPAVTRPAGSIVAAVRRPLRTRRRTRGRR